MESNDLHQMQFLFWGNGGLKGMLGEFDLKKGKWLSFVYNLLMLYDTYHSRIIYNYEKSKGFGLNQAC